MNTAGLLFPAPFPIDGLVAVPHVLAPAVALERLLVLVAVVGRWVYDAVLDVGGGWA